ncbi:hypothetical protein D5R40_33190 [Okeania hirsuta]|uniref:Uncharacterized protein n=1 Tax=Okeania hirsuta TaxID=1458930 RepID=A0A3N6QQL1_9CYAN|nr:contractile injection system tape measure protein [Okeania hirsuta]RQH17712.1 hypothetical protein D5R40_33190 [Okeania hirsuta]
MHLIRRQILDLELPRQEGAAKLAQQLGQLFEEKVLPELDQLFSQIIPDGRVLRIQRLEIDLDRISERGMEQFFVEQCVKKIGDQLTQHAFEVQRHSSDQEVLNIRQSEDVLFVVKHFFGEGYLTLVCEAYSTRWSLMRS